MVHIRLRRLHAQQIQYRQKHGTYGVKEIGKRNMRILGLAYIEQNAEKGLAHQKRHNADMLLVIHSEKGAPVGGAGKHKLAQRINLAFGESMIIAARCTESQRVVEKHLAAFDNVCGQLVLELSRILRLRTYHPQHIFVLRIGGDKRMHP